MSACQMYPRSLNQSTSNNSSLLTLFLVYLMGGVNHDEMKLLWSVLCSCRGETSTQGRGKNKIWALNRSQTNTCSRQIQGMLSRMDMWEDWVTAGITYMHGLIYSCFCRWYTIHCSLRNTLLYVKRCITFFLTQNKD